MIEIVVAYLRNFDAEKGGELTPDNLDLSTAGLIRAAKEKGHKFEFGKYNWREGSVEIHIERPDQAFVPAPGSQEEWEQKRAWYLKHSENSAPVARKGVSEGYITRSRARLQEGYSCDEDWQVPIVCPDYWMGLKKEVSLETLLKIQRQENTGSNIIKGELNPRDFLFDDLKLTPNRVEKVRKFRDKIYSGAIWSPWDIQDVGLFLPMELFQLRRQERTEYALRTLNTFLQLCDTQVPFTAREYRKKEQRIFITSLGLPPNLIKDIKKDPWSVYEQVKAAYCSEELPPAEYERRIEELTSVLEI